ncbi:MAG: 2-C-methyl-D-erythritol 4-phosphate cytidylyltransferase [Muribaculaceae bacterium]|nr:2-C-methyl-D-erythritol 4-phosphate cytidylyltransferase [Muribaculaceae bacterium]
MKNIALIFAGGTGRRMHTVSKPKQFLELNGKPVIVYTFDVFENHPLVDGIVVVCLDGWSPFLERQLARFNITKVGSITTGGSTGQESIYNGLLAVRDRYGEDCNVLIHDGVRPLINEQTITDNIEVANRCGNCITCVESTETLVVRNGDGTLRIPSRADSMLARAPQTFRLADILAVHEDARRNGKNDFIDSCTMMSHYGYKLNTIIGPTENIKITTPTDFYIFKALVEVHENKQIFGL